MFKELVISLSIILFFSSGISAQQLITLYFQSEEALDSVKVENLDNGDSRVITGDRFEFYADYPTGNDIHATIEESLCYPNPFHHETYFQISSESEGIFHITAFDISGRKVASMVQELDMGWNQFVFKPDHQGIFFLRANNNSSLYHSKVICIEANTSPARLEYYGDNARRGFIPDRLKSEKSLASDGFIASLGDMLKLTACSQNRIDTQYGFLWGDNSYEFSFPQRHFVIRKHFFGQRNPGILDVAFSVVDSGGRNIDYLELSDFSLAEDEIELSSAESFLNVRKSNIIPTHLRTVLLLDNSSKMGSGLESLKNSASKLVQKLAENQEMAIYTYSDSALLMSGFNDREIILDYWISKIKSNPGSSNLLSSIIGPLKKWQDQYTPWYAIQGSLILVSGGNDFLDEDLLEEVQLTRGNKRVYAITLDPASDSSLLKSIASEGNYYAVNDINDLDPVFTTIQTDIIRASNSYYYLNYFSQKRENNHEIRLSIIENVNTDSSAYFTESFNAGSFASVTPGVYLNPADTSLYGLDTIWCFSQRTKYAFSNHPGGEYPYAIDTLLLRPVTYGGTEAPVYSYELSKDNVFKIESLPLAGPALIPVNMARDTVVIKLRDSANGFTKNIVFIMDPPEFFENMGIVLAQIKDSRLDEISGIAASVKYPGYFWVHNDSGDDANLYLIDNKGNTIARVLVDDITSRDWEDIAVGPGPVDGESYIYVADIGDLDREHRYKYIYRLSEPEIDISLLKQNLRISSNGVSTFTYDYADGPRDAEILMIDPLTRDLFIVTKRETNVQIYTLPYPQPENDTLILSKSDVTLPFRMTNGGDISADGSEILIKNLTHVYYWKRLSGESVTETLARGAMSLPYIKEPQGEAIGWLRDGSGYVTVSEEKDGVTPVLYLYKR